MRHDERTTITPEQKREIQGLALEVLKDELDNHISLQEVLSNYYADEEDLER